MPHLAADYRPAPQPVVLSVGAKLIIATEALELIRWRLGDPKLKPRGLRAREAIVLDQVIRALELIR
jgi:hypothetical protein